MEDLTKLRENEVACVELRGYGDRIDTLTVRTCRLSEI